MGTVFDLLFDIKIGLGRFSKLICLCLSELMKLICVPLTFLALTPYTEVPLESAQSYTTYEELRRQNREEYVNRMADKYRKLPAGEQRSERRKGRRERAWQRG